MTSAYISSLRRSLAEEAEAPHLSKPDLRERFLAWLDSQPEISRLRPYAMTELENALGTQGRHLSAVLLRLGWERRRRWSSKGQYLRYWVPPHSNG